MGSYLLDNARLLSASNRWKRGETGKATAHAFGLTVKQFDEIRMRNRNLFPKRGFVHKRPKKVSIFMTDEVYDKLSRAAFRKRLSLSRYVRHLIQRDIEE